MTITIIGGGSWGTALAATVATRRPVVLWALEPEVVAGVNDDGENPLFHPGVTLPAALRATGDLAAALAGASLVVSAVPSQHVRSVFTRARSAISGDVPILSLTKGIESDSLLRGTQILSEVFNDAPVGVLAGPTLASEVIAGQPAAATVAFADGEVAKTVQHAVATDRFRVYTSQDVVGCELGGAVKNVIAIAAGIVVGMGYGHNMLAALISRGLAEMTRLGTAYGADPLTFLGLAGQGDLTVTCASPASRNHQVGKAIGAGGHPSDVLGDMVAEGVKTAPAVLAMAALVDVEMPICAEVAAVLAGERTPQMAVDRLLGRPLVSELWDPQ